MKTLKQRLYPDTIRAIWLAPIPLVYDTFAKRTMFLIDYALRMIETYGATLPGPADADRPLGITIVKGK